jgi:lincosamide nucleotidyltransferase A/C/D/E
MMDSEHAREVLEILEQAGVWVVVTGGWGVDALLGEETREHDDLDVHVAENDLEQVCAALARLGYVECLLNGRRENFILRATGDRRVDVHALRVVDDRGGGVYHMEDGSDWLWPPGSFSGVGSVGGRRVECLSFEGQLLEHTGYDLDEQDLLDVALLRERLGEPAD